MPPPVDRSSSASYGTLFGQPVDVKKNELISESTPSKQDSIEAASDQLKKKGVSFSFGTIHDDLIESKRQTFLRLVADLVQSGNSAEPARVCSGKDGLNALMELKGHETWTQAFSVLEALVLNVQRSDYWSASQLELAEKIVKEDYPMGNSSREHLLDAIHKRQADLDPRRSEEP